MDLYGCHFTLGDKHSGNLILAAGLVDRNSAISGKHKPKNIFSKKEKKNYFIDNDYAEAAMSFDIEIITDDGSVLDNSRLREIEKWLFVPSRYRKLYIDKEDDEDGETTEVVDETEKRLYLNCKFLDPKKLEYNGGVVGFSARLECDSSMAWQDAITKTITENSEIVTDTDLDDYIYPKVTIKAGDTEGDIIIVNVTDDSSRLTKFTGVPANAEIVMNGDINYISGDYYQYFSNRNFIRLLNGYNYIIMNGVSEITFEWQNRRYL